MANVIGDVYQFAQDNVEVLWKISCQMIKTGLLNVKQVC